MTGRRTGPTTLDLTAELPSGTTLLEASAGTGKTHTIASLVVVSVARGTPLRSILLITFTRKAARELRERLRARLTAALVVVRDGAPAGPDPIGDALLAGDPAVVCARLEEALAEFDAAAISTIHEFAGAMLSRLGLLAGRSPRVELLADESGVLSPVADDLYLARYGNHPAPPFSRQDGAAIAAAAIRSSCAAIVPDPAQHPATAERVDFAARARQEFQRRLRASGRYTYDDLIEGLAAALRRPVTGPATAARLREAFRVVMVDEFQDTDPKQWEVLQAAFHGHSDLYLIGDPKQAIYAFRGGDVHTYLAAARVADQHCTLATNWRSDEAVVRGIDSVLGGTALGDPGIRLGQVQARHTGSRLRDPVGTPAPGVELRVLAAPYRRITSQRDRIRRDVVATASRLLADGTCIVEDGASRPVRPSDIAILVRANWSAAEVARALVDQGIPAVVNGAGSVLSSPAAGHWLDLLATLLDPQANAVHRLALGPFVGWRLEELVVATEDATAELFVRVRGWARLWAEHGVAAVLEAALGEGGLAESALRVPGGERLLTDLRHVGSLLHCAESDGHLAPRELAGWLDRQVRTARSDGDDEHTLRRETEAEAVQVITVHSAKGLEFPIVLLPDMSDKRPAGNDVPAAFTVHDPAGARLVDVGGRRESSTRARHALALEESGGEDLRLLYVAMTRASCQVVMWWAPHEKYAPESPLHRALFGARDGAGTLPRQVPVVPGVPMPDLPAVRLAYVAADPGPAAALTPARPTGEVVLRHFARPVDRQWRRTSYSGLTADQHAATHEVPGDGDEPAIEVGGPGAEVVDLGTSPWGELPTGARFGTLVHAVLESWDPTTDDLAGPLARLVDRFPVPGLDAPALAEVLQAATRTPLGGDLAGLRLRDITVADRLSEMDFELPLGGGDVPGRSGTVSDIADLLERHMPADDPLVGYPARLRAHGLGEQTLRGFLTGSIDAVLRVPGPVPRFVVVDFKTNWLGSPAGQGPLPLAAYTPDRLAEAMMAAHYPLQALLYSVALHRFLTWRLPGYHPAEHLGGIRYLFVRGMVGPDTPSVEGTPCGVFAWRPSAMLVTELSDLVTEGRPGR